MDKVVVGSRDSQLALLQTRHIISRLKEVAPDKEYVIKEIKTQGDKILDVALAKIGDKGLFVKEIESALLEGEIDLAVHSMKDVPTAVPEGLKIGCITEREDPRDVVIGSGEHKKIDDLPSGAIVGTSSLRRIAQLSRHRPDLKMESVRGNLNTRLRKLKEENYAVLILAYAGVLRMGWLDQVTQIIPSDICLPAVGQGALGIEIRNGDERIEGLVSKLNDPVTNAAVTAERGFLRRLEGGCQVPIGALGEVEGGKLHLTGVIASLDGKEVLRDKEVGPIENAQEIGNKLAENLLERGAAAILDKVRREFDTNE